MRAGRRSAIRLSRAIGRVTSRSADGRVCAAAPSRADARRLPAERRPVSGAVSDCFPRRLGRAVPAAPSAARPFRRSARRVRAGAGRVLRQGVRRIGLGACSAAPSADPPAGRQRRPAGAGADRGAVAQPGATTHGSGCRLAAPPCPCALAVRSGASVGWPGRCHAASPTTARGPPSWTAAGRLGVGPGPGGPPPWWERAGRCPDGRAVGARADHDPACRRTAAAGGASGASPRR